MTDLRVEVDTRLVELEGVLARGGLLRKAASKVWDELLHPRGRDGKFIEKGGWVNGSFQIADGSNRPAVLEGNDRVKVTGFTKNPNNPDDPFVNVVLTNGTPAQGLASQVQMAAPTKANLPDDYGDTDVQPGEVDVPQTEQTAPSPMSAEERAFDPQRALKQDRADAQKAEATLDKDAKKQLAQWDKEHADQINDPNVPLGKLNAERRDLVFQLAGVDRSAATPAAPSPDDDEAQAEAIDNALTELDNAMAKLDAIDNAEQLTLADAPTQGPPGTRPDLGTPGFVKQNVATNAEAPGPFDDVPSDAEGADFDPPNPDKQTISFDQITEVQQGPGDPVETDDPIEALELLARGEKVKLHSKDEVVVLLDKMHEMYLDAEAKGEKAPTYNLCDVFVENKSLFCADHKDINRLGMPQLKGVPLPGTPAAALPANAKGEVDLGPAFRKHLEDMGVPILDTDSQASHLKATQNFLNGSKVAGMGKAMDAGKMSPQDERLFTSADNYIVDGHHRWGASLGIDLRDGQGGDIYMPVAQIDMDILDIIAEANKFSIEMGIPPSAGGQAAPTTLAEAPPEAAPASQTQLLERVS